MLINGELEGDASALVTFVISEPTEVMYSVSGLPFALFERIDVYESIVFIEQSDEIQSGQRLLAPGTYIMSAGFPFADDDGAGGFLLASASRVGFSLQVVPAPGGAAALMLAGAGLGGARRRRPE